MFSFFIFGRGGSFGQDLGGPFGGVRLSMDRTGKVYIGSDVLYDWERYHRVAGTMWRLAIRHIEHILDHEPLGMV